MGQAGNVNCKCSVFSSKFEIGIKSKNINSIIMAGNIIRPSLSDLSFDFQTFKLAKKLLLSKTGDNDLLISIKNVRTSTFLS